MTPQIKESINQPPLLFNSALSSVREFFNKEIMSKNNEWRDFKYNVVETKVVKLGRDECYSRWLDVIWMNGGGLGNPTILDAGDPTTKVGCLRLLVGGVQEKILETDNPIRIEYTVTQGFMPFKKHHGIVTFTEGEGGCTNVTWTCYYEPTFIGNFVCLSLIIRLSFQRMLSTLALSAE